MGNDEQPPLQNKGNASEAARDAQGRLLPGSTANPGGRPSTKWIRDFMAEVAKPGGQPRKMALIQAMFLTSIDRRHKDHVKAGTLLLAYDAGLPVQSVELSGPDGAPIDGDISGWTSEQQAARLEQLLAKANAEVAAAAANDGEEDR